jgi:AbrB family looped-hinge helix DNA binding protein
MLTTATTKGQIVIPSKIRHQLGIKEGTKIKIEVDEKNHALILMPITREYIQSLCGKYRKLNLIEELKSERKQERNWKMQPW